ncbi:CopG family transcriptional regulator [Nocardia cyriacigeorgica]|uniref:ribbon-helix-helix domain-containing protein n=1 Tax=Nocardia cyriacigeorgica TaxID=135487 RepID=UPI0013D29664|nr:CopG family transcriptional regulator [Nocardia cyriacigeorgica]MBF6437625.1 CopG family transcriptional regulator [Nocardia cyriacigeorgica]MBF6453192.1 CopG family transcriptional regulator [Nocardia cyriacigeorgica]MBF6478802.1 CopG family transcriptional regulator [Nocardia cyriacigeorgica]MBF6550361.1 CopG family transcriptional regulator [Nocardia cyriacigeorgica]NEW28512.1 CopG family transcriptional regulator [Nocardia cyriacigeorgica]
MKRTTVKLPDELDERMRHEAQRRGITVSELTRAAVAQFLSMPPEGRRQFGAAGAGRSGQSDVSSRIDEILSAEWGR